MSNSRIKVRRKMKFDENLRVGVDRVRDVVKTIVKTQGFLVIGFPKPNLKQLEMLRPGFRTTQFCQYELGEEYEAFEFGSLGDWAIQFEFLSVLFGPSWTAVEVGDDAGIFLRLRPVGEKH